jgi:hypothetical protein
MNASEVQKALFELDTRAQWSTLAAIQKKMSSKKVTIGLAELAAHVRALDRSILREQGIWITEFGKKYQPIICINAAYRRTVANGASTCSCGVGGTETEVVGKKRKAENDKRYYESHDYNAGRHATELSIHKMNCICWTPLASGHLHSWRRGF